jgi:oxygen-independent coproporphyrinogen III oxidase
MIAPLPVLSQTPYAGYAYSYPHKTAYRPLAPPAALRDLWSQEPRDALFLYWHVPFCEMRCGFCNLFTIANPEPQSQRDYLDALERQTRAVSEAVRPARFARMAIGGGTPTYLTEAGLNRLLDLGIEHFGADPAEVPTSVETSPQTSTPEKLRVLRERGVERVSIGVQSFVEAEVRAAGRAQSTREVETALERLRDVAFPVLNVDLMYGLPGQTTGTWLGSLEAALRYHPEELYLYPLYVRPLTGLHRVGAEAWDAVRLDCYRAARELLISSGYEQVSMRMFRRGPSLTSEPVYCCQDDGMVGLGCGARSYTAALHYSTEYAVARTGVRDILRDYLARPAQCFAFADYGIRLNDEEQRRRYILKSLLRCEGLDLSAYRARFGAGADDQISDLAQLTDLGLAVRTPGRLRLTPDGLERSDALGPWLYSEAVKSALREYAPR